MPILVVVAYRDETSAGAAGEEAHRLVRYLAIEPDAIAVVRRDATGRLHLTTNHDPLGGDVAWGMVWMLVSALLFGPPAPVRRTDTDLESLLAAVARSGVGERFRAEVRDRIDPGTSALLLGLGTGSLDRVAEVLGRFGGEVLQTPMAAAGLAALRELLPAGIGEPALSAGRDPAPGTG